MLAARILHCRIRLQQHFLAKPVQVNTGDHWSLLRYLRLALDDRRERHQLMSTQAELSELGAPFRLPLPLESLHHLEHSCASLRSVGEGVRVGKQIALEGPGG